MRWLRNRLISVLFKLTDYGESKWNDEKVEKWLSELYGDPRFEQYVRMRTYKLLKEMAGGAGMKEQPRDDYVRMAGQRFEILRLADLARKAHENKDK